MKYTQGLHSPAINRQDRRRRNVQEVENVFVRLGGSFGEGAYCYSRS
jgi:hypothetical protein